VDNQQNVTSANTTLWIIIVILCYSALSNYVHCWTEKFCPLIERTTLVSAEGRSIVIPSNLTFFGLFLGVFE
jgi:hypothetical protein